MEIEDLNEKLKPLIMQSISFNNAAFTLIEIRPTYYSHQNWSVEPHQHPWFEFYYFESGDFYTVIDGKEIQNKPDTYMLIKPKSVHSHHHGNTLTAKQLVIRFMLSGINDNTNSFYESIYKKLCMTTPVCNAHLELLKLKGAASYEDQLAIWQYLIEICQPAVAKVNIESNIPYQIELYLQKNYSHKISVSEIANATGYSYRNISRIYRHATGLTISDKLSSIRIQEAQKLLVKTDLLIHEIALKVGFENTFYFSNAFKKKNEISPSQYRNNYKLEPTGK